MEDLDLKQDQIMVLAVVVVLEQWDQMEIVIMEDQEEAVQQIQLQDHL